MGTFVLIRPTQTFYERINIDPMHYYLPDADMDETRAQLLKAGFEIEGHIRDCQGAGCGATCGCPCHVGELRG